MPKTAKALTSVYSVYLHQGGEDAEGRLDELLRNKKRRQQLMRDLMIAGFLAYEQGVVLDPTGERLTGLVPASGTSAAAPAPLRRHTPAGAGQEVGYSAPAAGLSRSSVAGQNLPPAGPAVESAEDTSPDAAQNHPLPQPRPKRERFGKLV